MLILGIAAASDAVFALIHGLPTTLPRLRPPLRHPIFALLVAGICAAAAAGVPDAPKRDGQAVPSKRRYVAVMDLAAQGVDKSSAQVLTDALGDEILRLKKLRLMERSQMQNILKEQGFQESGACDVSECAVQIGKILGIDLMIVGTIGKIGATHTISVRAVDISTSEVVASTRRSVKGEIDALLTESIHEVAVELVSSIANEDIAALSPTPRALAPDTLVDPRDDQRYPYARFGNLFWTTRNMNYRLSDFTSWCYEDAKGNCDYLGRLYNWNKATLACPAGWRLPTTDDWNDLVSSLGGPQKAAEAMRGPRGGKDNSVFRARAGGFRDPEGNYLGIGGFSVWWTSTESDGELAQTQSLDFAGDMLEADPASKDNGYSVRCVKSAR